MEHEEENDEPLISINRGRRSEEIAEWYFRLNGVFLIHGFIVHPDLPRPNPRTEADFLGIRLKNSSEGVWRKSKGDRFRSSPNRAHMRDDVNITNASHVGTVKKNLVVMVEVKAGICSINGPWSDIDSKDNENVSSNMERALSRVGFGNKEEVKIASKNMYENLRYEGKDFVVQYFAVGRIKSEDLQNRYPQLVQINFNQIASFLRDRFIAFPEKIPMNKDISLWRGFGDSFLRWFESEGLPSIEQCQNAITSYINTGSCWK